MTRDRYLGRRKEPSSTMTDHDAPADDAPEPRDHGLNADEEADALLPDDLAQDALAQRINARIKQSASPVPAGTPALDWKAFTVICAHLAETGVKYKSCEAGGFRYQTVRQAIHGETAAGNGEWQELWDLSLEHFRESLVKEARSRAVDGWKEPLFYKGELQGYVRRKSDRLLELLMRGHLPEVYRDNVNVSGSMDLTGGGLDIFSELSLDAKKRIRDIMMEDLKAQAAATAAKAEA
jgi:hypothetical protein